MVMLRTDQQHAHITVVGDNGHTLGLIRHPDGPVQAGPKAGTVLLDRRPSVPTHPRLTRRPAHPPR